MAGRADRAEAVKWLAAGVVGGVIALVAGAALSDHDSPTEATLQVLRGHVVLTSADGDPAGRWEGATGDLVTIPSTRHGLTAQEDSAILLTVATR
mgnify:CR=1 FL=1